MVASKTSILVAAVALGAATAYAAPTSFNKDITLSRREAEESALVAREFDDDELYAREFYDDLDARDFEDDGLEARDFDEDELYARELYEDVLEARDFDDLFTRAVEATPSKNSTSTPSSTATSSTSTPSSTDTSAAKNDKHALVESTTLHTSTAHTDEEDHVCIPYLKAYEILTGQLEHEHHVHEHDSHNRDRPHHDVHKHDNHRHHHHHDRHRHHHHHHLSAHKVADECGPVIARLVKLGHPEHGKVADATTDHSTESKTLKVQTPTKAKRDLNQLWARVIQGDKPVDLPQNPDPAGSSSAQNPGTDGSLTSPPLSDTVSDNGQHKKPHGHRHSHHRGSGYPAHHSHHHRHGHHHHHHHHNGHGHGHGRHGRHGNQHTQQLTSGVTDSTKSATDTAVNSGAPTTGDTTGSPATSGSVTPGVQRRSVGDDMYWKRSLAGALGLDLDYFTKRFYGEDGFEY